MASRLIQPGTYTSPTKPTVEFEWWICRAGSPCSRAQHTMTATRARPPALFCINPSMRSRTRREISVYPIPTIMHHGNKAAAAQFRSPYGLAVDGAAYLYVSDATSFRVHKVAADGTISLVAGVGTQGYLGDGGLATAAQLAYPTYLALDGP